MRYLSFQPIYQERIWGGRGLETKLNRTLPGKQPIGESWEIVDRPEAQSVVSAGTHQGKRIIDLLKTDPGSIMGPHWPQGKPFPILVKWLDCQERLSLQVHPPAHVAEALKGEPKTENWYIAEAEQNASLIVGLKAGATREQFENALKSNQLEECVHRFSVDAGESIFVQSGRLHAIDGGNLILEIQQNSDTTYRVYDWGRVGLDGKSRQLHIEASMQCIDFNDFEPASIKPQPGEQLLAQCDEFRLRKLDLKASQRLQFNALEEPRILSVVEGSIKDVSDNSTLARGANIILPYAESFEFVADSAAKLIITDQFTA